MKRIFVVVLVGLLTGLSWGGEYEADFDVTLDTFIREQNPETTFEGDQFIGSGRGSGPLNRFRGMLYYDLSDIPPSAEILDAAWLIHVFDYEEPGDYEFGLYRITEDWVSDWYGY